MCHEPSPVHSFLVDFEALLPTMAESNAERRERRVHAGLSRELSKPGTQSTWIRPVEVLVADIDPTIQHPPITPHHPRSVLAMGHGCS